jgi:hypothetical protein
LRDFRKIITRAAVVGLGCSAAIQLAALGSPALAATAGGAAPHSAPPVFLKQPRIQLGAGVDLYSYQGQDFVGGSAAEVTYLKKLNANSVLVSFPFFNSGRKSNTVFSKVATPTPAQLAIFAKAAISAGIYFGLRPLMDQGAINESRANWQPPNQKAWFASYQKFLIPYAKMAQQVKIPIFYVGAEFSRFGQSRYWNSLDAALRKVYKGTLAYANNGAGVHAGEGGRNVQRSADAYPNLGVGANPTLSRLTAAWKAYDKRLPRKIILSEVGISGVKGAFLVPWQHHWPHPKIDSSVQVRWFGASCSAAGTVGIGGIYFWAIGFGQSQLVQKLDAQHQGAWENGPAEKATAACFHHIRTGK